MVYVLSKNIKFMKVAKLEENYKKCKMTDMID